MIIRGSNLTINVKDIDRSLSFYESIGFFLKDRWDNHFAQMTAPGITIGLHPSSGVSGSGNLSIGLTTNNMEEVKSMLKSLSIAFQTRTEEGGDFIHFVDPDGTKLYFVESKW